MTATLEWRKARRTGLLPAGLGGCALAAAAPICNMALRAETYLSQPGGALQILLDANWPVMAMIHALVDRVSIAFSITRTVGNAMAAMRTLPLRETSLFLLPNRFIGAAGACARAWSFGLAARHWSGAGGVGGRGGKELGVLHLDVATGAFAGSTGFVRVPESMGLVGIGRYFSLRGHPGDSLDGFAWTLWPFALPFQALGNVAESEAWLTAYSRRAGNAAVLRGGRPCFAGEEACE